MLLNSDSKGLVLSSDAMSSPVTWHVILWIILSLAINSMAQPAGKISGIPSRYRIYLASSPIICLADATGMIVRIVTSALLLRISLRKASQFAVLTRSESEDATLPKEESENQSSSQGHTWPRWLFFTMGPLPAAIKLCSFSGVPWAKAFGLMFVVSFIVIEILTALGRSGASAGSNNETAMVTLTPRTPVLSSKSQHHDSHSLTRRIQTFEVILFSIALLAHICLVVWASESMRLALPTIESVSVNACRLIKWVVIVIFCSVYGLLVIFLGLWLVLWLIGYQHRGEKSVVGRILRWLFQAVMLTAIFCPEVEGGVAVHTQPPKIPPPPLWTRSIKGACQPWCYLCAAGYLGYMGLTWVCKHWPVVGKALLVERRAKEIVQAQLESQAAGEDDVTVEEKGAVMKRAWIALCFFFTNLVVCALWYAFMYKSTGTKNPDWTDVFG